MLKHISAFMTFYSPVQNLLTAPFSPSPLRSRRVAAPRSAPGAKGGTCSRGGSFAPGAGCGAKPTKRAKRRRRLGGGSAPFEPEL